MGASCGQSMGGWFGIPARSNMVPDQLRKSKAVRVIIQNRRLEKLRTILRSGWEVNEIYLNMTALHEAARSRWTEGVKLLLDAGAQCKVSGCLANPLALALQDRNCPPDLIELLLKHGADPNHHDGILQNIPLLLAIRNRHTQRQSVELLLEYGADVTVMSSKEDECPLSVALCQSQFQPFEVFPLLFKLLVQSGADVNYNVARRMPLLHELISIYKRHPVLLHQQLDLFFQHGGNINVEDRQRRTALEHAVSGQGHSNSLRWLIRHGADTSLIKLSPLKVNFIPYMGDAIYYETPLILLQAGMRVSHGAQTQLSNMELAISTWLQDDSPGVVSISKTMHRLWVQLREAEMDELLNMQQVCRKSSFPEYWSEQVADLQEFSDESLQVYPDVAYIHSGDMTRTLQIILDHIRRVLEFLSQPQSLQWYCRCCIRENLVSLQPSVVNSLPIPPRLKRYILCHEI